MGFNGLVYKTRPDWVVHEAVVSEEESSAVGLIEGAHINSWGDKIKPTLIEKGIPEHCLVPGYMPFHMQKHDDGRIFWFGS